MLSSAFLLGVLGVFIGIILGKLSLKKVKPFPDSVQKPWLIGVFTLIFNLVVIAFACLAFYFIPSAVGLFAALISVYGWLIIKYASICGIKQRLKIAIFGQGVYWLLMFYFIYKYANVEPQYPGGDPFMLAFGYFLAAIICLFASVIGFIIFITPRPER